MTCTTSLPVASAISPAASPRGQPGGFQHAQLDELARIERARNLLDQVIRNIALADLEDRAQLVCQSAKIGSFFTC